MKQLILILSILGCILSHPNCYAQQDSNEIQQLYGTVQNYSSRDVLINTKRDLAPDNGYFIIHSLGISNLLQIVDTQYMFEKDPDKNWYWISKEVNQKKSNSLIFCLIIITAACFLIGLIPLKLERGTALRIKAIILLIAVVGLLIFIKCIEIPPYISHLAEQTPGLLIAVAPLFFIGSFFIGHKLSTKGPSEIYYEE